MRVIAAITILLAACTPTAGVLSGETPSGTPALAQPKLLVANRLITDRGPGGMPIVTTDAFESFEILSTSGAVKTYALSGVAVGTPVFDGRSRVAFWKRPSLAGGAQSLAVWDIVSGLERVLLTLSDEPPGSGLLWTADSRSLILWPRTPGSNSQGRLMRVDPSTGDVRVIALNPLTNSVRPVFADDDVIVGVGVRGYVVIDARSGELRTEVPLRQPYASEFTASPDGSVLELVRPFESSAGPLRIWSARSPSTTFATVAERGIDSPLFWPGRTEAVYTEGTGISAIDYRTGATRLVASLAEPPGLVVFDAAAEFLVAYDASGYLIMERSGDGLRPRTDLRFPGSTSLRDVLGVIR